MPDALREYAIDLPENQAAFCRKVPGRGIREGSIWLSEAVAARLVKAHGEAACVEVEARKPKPKRSKSKAAAVKPAPETGADKGAEG